MPLARTALPRRGAMRGDSAESVFDWSEWNYELFPDILPDLHWEGTDGLGRKVRSQAGGDLLTTDYCLLTTY